MITNDKQYRSTRTQVEKLRSSLNNMSAASSDVHPMFLAAHKEALDSQLHELEEEIAAYDQLRSGAITTFSANSLQELPELLISARIARNMSQKELGTFIGVHEQQIQRYEAERYRSASLDRLIQISAALSVRISEQCELIGADHLQSFEDVDFGSFPITEMYSRGYFEDFDGTATQARKASSTLIPEFFRNANKGWMPSALHRRSIRSKGQVHEYALAAWEARVVLKADRNPPITQFKAEHINSGWLKTLVAKSAKDIGITEVSNFLWEAGIALVIEPHLPGTLLDGAALLSPSGAYVVAMTLRHDRLDNFWFTLLHEIAHLALHVSSGEFSAIFDNNDVAATSELEKQADEFALEASIPSETWASMVCRFTRTETAVIRDAKRLGISPAIVAGRIRKEAENYTLLTNLVGSGEVRKHFNM